MTAANLRFSEYVTSGAFQISLTRSQIAALAVTMGGDNIGYQGSQGALSRKGLIEPITGRDGYTTQWRLTSAGALVLALCHTAGLTNAGADALAAEIDSLRAELAAARECATASDHRAWSMKAKLDAALDKIDTLEAKIENKKMTVKIRARDPMPEKSADELMAEIKATEHLHTL